MEKIAAWDTAGLYGTEWRIVAIEISKAPEQPAAASALPFAQKRFCQEFEINKIKTLSDHRSASFGINYGVLIKELRLLARAIFLVDKNDNVTYVEYVKEVSMPPNYDAALAALKKLV